MVVIKNDPTPPPEVQKLLRKADLPRFELARTPQGLAASRRYGLAFDRPLLLLRARVRPASLAAGGGHFHELCPADGLGVQLNGVWLHSFWLPDEALSTPAQPKRPAAKRKQREGA